MSPCVSLILVTHNSARWLRPFAESWRATVSGAGAPPEWFVTCVADGGSADESPALAAELLPETRIRLCGNVGYGAAANDAIREAGAPWILLCNPDATFSPEFGSRLYQILRADERRRPHWLTEKVGCIAPRLLNPDGTIQPSVGRFPTLAGIARDQFQPRPQRKFVMPQPNVPGPIDWATGACLLLRRDAFLAVGGFDEKYFLYVEEVDLQRRLPLAGYTAMFAPDLVVTHHRPNAAREPRPDVQLWAARGTLRYFAKFAGAGTLCGYRILSLAGGRLRWREAMARRRTILERATGP